jgi:hypothetical protein
VASVGDKVRVLPNKAGQPPREGEVTGVSGTLLRVRWSTGEESSFVPGAGSVTVFGKVRAGSTTKKSGASTKKATDAPKKTGSQRSAKSDPAKKASRRPKT